jgi:rhodanese-related sulfurtransferase
MSGIVTPDALEELLKGHTPPRVLDVRRRTDRASDPWRIPGAEWKDPERTTEWGKDLGSGEVVVYCARGGSVSRSVQEKLRELKIDVKFIEGGLEAWKRSGKPVELLPFKDDNGPK